MINTFFKFIIVFITKSLYLNVYYRVYYQRIYMHNIHRIYIKKKSFWKPVFNNFFYSTITFKHFEQVVVTDPHIFIFLIMERFQRVFFRRHFIRPTTSTVNLKHLHHCHKHRVVHEKALSQYIHSQDGVRIAPPLIPPCHFQKTTNWQRTHIIDGFMSFEFRNDQYQCMTNKKAKMFMFGGVRHSIKLPQASREPAFRTEQSVKLQETDSPILSITQTFGVTFALAVKLHHLTEQTKKVSSPCMYTISLTYIYSKYILSILLCS